MANEHAMWSKAQRDPGGYVYDSPWFARVRQQLFNGIGGVRQAIEQGPSVTAGKGGLLSKVANAPEGLQNTLPLLDLAVKELYEMLNASKDPASDEVRNQILLVGTWATTAWEATFIEERK